MNEVRKWENRDHKDKWKKAQREEGSTASLRNREGQEIIKYGKLFSNNEKTGKQIR